MLDRIICPFENKYIVVLLSIRRHKNMLLNDWFNSLTQYQDDMVQRSRLYNNSSICKEFEGTCTFNV